MTSGPPKVLLQQLITPESAEAAAAQLAENPQWLKLKPPKQVVVALADDQHPHDSEIIQLAMAWNPATLGPALLDALVQETATEKRRRLAWVIKQNPDPSSIAQLLALARSTNQDRIVRRYLLEAVTRLAFAGDVDWFDLVSTVRELRSDVDAGVREAAAALIGAGDDDHNAKRRTELIAFLNDEEPAVIATAATALQRFDVRERDLPKAMVQRLRNHTRPDIRLIFEAMLSDSP